MLRHTLKTEICSISIADGKRTLLFSDEGTNLELAAFGAISIAGKAYLPGVWRQEPAGTAQGVVTEHGLYDVSLDGSKQFRRVLDGEPNQLPPILNPQSTKALFQTFVDGKWKVSIYSVPEWKLLESWELSQLMKARCPDCEPLSNGWMADGKRLYFVLGLVGEKEADHPDIRDTPYIVSQTGADLGPIPPELGALDLPGYVHPPATNREFLGQLRDGSYVFNDFAVPKGGPFHSPKPYLVVFDPISKSRRQFPLKFPMGGFISPSGKYLAYVEQRRTPDFRSEQHLWVIDLDSGIQKELYSTPPTQPPSSVQPNVSLGVLGWLEKN